VEQVDRAWVLLPERRRAEIGEHIGMLIQVDEYIDHLSFFIISAIVLSVFFVALSIVVVVIVVVVALCCV
jgi:hypothetical protein